MFKFIFILFLLIFLSSKIYSQEYSPIFTDEEETYLFKKGLPKNYEWNNELANVYLLRGLKNRKTANTFLYSAIGAGVFGSFFFLYKRTSDTNLNFPSHVYLFLFTTGTFSSIIGGFIRLGAKSKVKKAINVIENR